MDIDLGKKIYTLRIENKDSQEDLAQKINVSRQTISKWENNINSPDFKTLTTLAAVYNVNMSVFSETIETEPQKKPQNIPSIFFFDTIHFDILLIIMTTLLMIFLGPLSLFVTVPYLYFCVLRKKKGMSIIFSLFVLMGIYILFTIYFPGFLPHTIKAIPVPE